MFLDRTSLSLQDHETHMEGKVSDFLNKVGDGTIPPTPFHKALRAEVRRRNDKEYAATTFSDLARNKGLSRQDIQRMLESIPTQRKVDDLVATIRQQLINENYDVRQQGLLNAEVRNYLSKRLDETNTVLTDARQRAAEEVSRLTNEVFESTAPLKNAIAKVTNVQSEEFAVIQETYSEAFLQALVVVAVYEQHQFPPTTAQSPKENS